MLKSLKEVEKKLFEEIINTIIEIQTSFDLYRKNPSSSNELRINNFLNKYLEEVSREVSLKKQKTYYRHILRIILFNTTKYNKKIVTRWANILHEKIGDVQC